MRRHFKGAKFEQAQAPGRTIGRIQFVDGKFRTVGVAGEVNQKVAQQSIHQPGLVGFFAAFVFCRFQCGISQRHVHLLEGDFELVERVVPRFIHARALRGRTDEGAGKQIRQRRMILPIRDQAAQ